MFSGPVRGGTRGGQGDFKWSDVADDKDRENYLGHSILAPVGRWQKNKDITWYNKEGGAIDKDERLKAKREEIARIKAAEEDALSAALGFKPAPRDPMASATTQSSSNAIPLGPRSGKPDSSSEHENADKKAEKSLRKAARAAKREQKAKEEEEKKLKKLASKQSRKERREIEKRSREHHDYDRRGDRRSHRHLDSPDRLPRSRQRSLSAESAHRTKSFSHSKHRLRPPSPHYWDRHQRPVVASCASTRRKASIPIATPAAPWAFSPSRETSPLDFLC